MASDFITIAVEILWKPAELLRAARKAKARVLKRGAGIVRGIMRRSIKFRAGSKSSPGTPPYSHVRSGGIRNLIFWEYNEAESSAVIGPVLDPSAERNINPVPNTLEQGGRTRIKLTKAIRAKVGRSSMVVSVKPRPFAGPALDAFESSYPDLWKEAIN